MMNVTLYVNSVFVAVAARRATADTRPPHPRDRSIHATTRPSANGWLFTHTIPTSWLTLKLKVRPHSLVEISTSLPGAHRRARRHLPRLL